MRQFQPIAYKCLGYLLKEEAPLPGSESMLGYLSQVAIRVKAERIFLMESAFLFRVHSK